MEPVSVTASFIGIIGGISATYRTIKTVKGLPKAFDEVQNDFPLVTRVLSHVHATLCDSQDITDDEKDAIMTMLQSSRSAAEELKRVFEEVKTECERDSGAKDWARFRVIYHKALRGMKASRVERLMLEILSGLKKLALRQIFELASQHDIQPLDKAIQDLAKVDPSLPDSEFGGEGQIIASQHNASGAIASQNNVHGGGNNFYSGKYVTPGTGNNFYDVKNAYLSNDPDDAAITRCRDSLRFEHMLRRRDEIDSPTVDTLEWLYLHEEFDSWIHQNRQGLLWLKGKPGCGKSTTMKFMIASKSLLHLQATKACVSHFFEKQGSLTQKTFSGFLRSLLFQWTYVDSNARAIILDAWTKQVQRGLDIGKSSLSSVMHWSKDELVATVYSIFTSNLTPPTLIIVDAVDECGQEDSTDAIEVVMFCRNLLSIAAGHDIELHISISCRSSKTFGEDGTTLILDQNNRGDIRTHVQKQLVLRQATALTPFVERIVTTASGIFLWAKLVTRLLCEDFHRQRNLMWISDHLEKLASKTSLVKVYQDMLASSHHHSEADRLEQLRFFQWIVFANRHLQLREWYAVACTIQEPPFQSLREWFESDRVPRDFEDNSASRSSRKPEDIIKDEALIDSIRFSSTKREKGFEGWLRRVSCGLVEVTPTTSVEVGDRDSTVGGQGSIFSQVGESRTVRVIHLSVYELFRNETFGGLLSRPLILKQIAAEGHATIIQSCLNYLNLRELDPLVEMNKKAPTTANGGSGIYRNEYVPYAYSAAVSQASSDEDRVGRLPLAPIGLTPGGIEGLQDLAREIGTRTDRFRVPGNISMEGVMDWLAESVENIHLATAILGNGISISPSLSNATNSCEPDEVRKGETKNEPGDLADTKATVDDLAGSLRRSGGDLTVLLQYASDEIFIHAAQPEIRTTRLEWLIKSMLEAWGRIVHLRTDLRSQASFVQYCVEAGLEELAIPTLNYKSCNAVAKDIAVPAIRLGKQDILQDLVLNQMKALKSQLSVTEIMQPTQQVQLQDDVTSSDRALLAEKYCDLIPSLLEAAQDPSQFANASATDVFDAWRCACDALRSQGLISTAEIQQVLKCGQPSPLLVACKEKELGMIQALLDMGLNNCDNGWETDAIDYLCDSTGPLDDRSLQILKKLIVNGADANATRRDRAHIRSTRTPLHCFCNTEDPDWQSVEMLLKKGADPNHKDHDGRIPLHYICLISRQVKDIKSPWQVKPKLFDMCRIVSALVQHGSDVNSQDHNGNTPLHLLSIPGHFFSLIPLLIKYDVSLHLRNKRGEVPVFDLYTRCYIDSHMSLLKSSSLSSIEPASLRDYEGHSPFYKHLSKACNYNEAYAKVNFMSLYRLLSLFGFDVNEAPKNGLTPLSLVCKTSWMSWHGPPPELSKLARLLLAFGANIYAIGWKGRMALHWAASEAHLAIIKSILKKAEKERRLCVNVLDADDNRPLHLLVQGLSKYEATHRRMHPSRRECMLLLIRSGANVLAYNGEGRTALQVLEALSPWQKSTKRELHSILKDAEHAARKRQADEYWRSH